MNKPITREERQKMVDEAAKNYLLQLIEAGEDDVRAGRTVIADEAFWAKLEQDVIADRDE